jgi:hypothetical protein
VLFLTGLDGEMVKPMPIIKWITHPLYIQNRNKMRRSVLMDLNDKITEMKLEQIRVYLSKSFPNVEETRQSTLNLVVEYFFTKHFKEICEANN